jgi:hypothetical protein
VIALAADFRIMARSASLAFLFTRVGLAGADMGSAYLLPRLVGLARATELLLLGDRLDAGRAEELVGDEALGRGEHDGAVLRRGLVDEVGSHHAAGAGAVLGDKGLAEPVGEPLPDQPRRDVDPAAGRKAGDDAHRAGRIIRLGGNQRDQTAKAQQRWQNRTQRKALL